MIPAEKCKGCRNDFYNGRQNFDGSTRCWSAKDGKMVKRYRLHWWTAPTVPGAFTEVMVPNCYHQPGQYAFQEKLPTLPKHSMSVNKDRS